MAVPPVKRSPRASSRSGKGGVARAEAAMQGPHRLRRMALRLDPQRYVRLKLLSAYTRQSSQQLLLEALDRFLASECETACVPDDCACLKQAKATELAR